MSKYSICIIGVYFGKLPAYFNLWLKSCEYNSDIDFFIITDNELYDLPPNVKCVKMSLSTVKELADNALGFQTSLDTPYKCCDFRPAYGDIFQSFIHNYSFWGHCDFDMLFGDIRKFITDDVLDKYDKIFPYGHLSLYRNTPEVNSRYKLQGYKYGDYVDVYKNSTNVAFDEKNGIGEIYKYNGIQIFDEKVYLDIYSLYHRFKVVHIQKNYLSQAFYWEKGKVYMAYKDLDKIFCDEYVYIHFKKRNFTNSLDNKIYSFYVSPKGFSKKASLGMPTLAEINENNPYVFIVELRDFLSCIKKRVFNKIAGAKRRILKYIK